MKCTNTFDDTSRFLDSFHAFFCCSIQFHLVSFLNHCREGSLSWTDFVRIWNSSLSFHIMLVISLHLLDISVSLWPVSFHLLGVSPLHQSSDLTCHEYALCPFQSHPASLSLFNTSLKLLKCSALDLPVIIT